MTRSRASAKQAAAKFNRDIADALKAALGDDRIDKMPQYGAKDRGDVAGVRLHGQRVVLELKNEMSQRECVKCGRVSGMKLPQWTREARIEAGNDDALVGLVVHKRHGVGDPMQQWVTCTLADLVAILTGEKVQQ